jgi:hypothetical protein
VAYCPFDTSAEEEGDLTPPDFQPPVLPAYPKICCSDIYLGDKPILLLTHRKEINISCTNTSFAFSPSSLE